MSNLRMISETQIDERPARDEQTMQFVSLALRVLGQRVANLGSAIFPILVLSMGLYLWNGVMPSPNVLQLAGLGMYSVFALLLTLIIRRK